MAIGLRSIYRPIGVLEVTVRLVLFRNKPYNVAERLIQITDRVSPIALRLFSDPRPEARGGRRQLVRKRRAKDWMLIRQTIILNLLSLPLDALSFWGKRKRIS